MTRINLVPATVFAALVAAVPAQAIAVGSTTTPQAATLAVGLASPGGTWVCPPHWGSLVPPICV